MAVIMKIKQRFGIYNTFAFLTPILSIGVISVLFVVLFILMYPAQRIGVSRESLLNPLLFIKALSEFVSRKESVIYIVIYLALCVAAMIVSGIISSGIMAQSISRSINELKEAAYRIGGGDLDFEVMGSTYDEIDELCSEFDSMRRRLKAAKEHEKAIKHERSMLLANLSHDLRTPVTSIKGYVEGIMDGVANTDEKRQQYLMTIYKKTEQISDILNNMSDLSRLELDKEIFNFEKCEINEFLKEIISRLGLDLEKNNMEVVFEALDENAYIFADRIRLGRVFSNLIENAIKYKKDGKGLLTIKVFSEDGNIFVVLTDTGIGISPDELERVFNSFYRIDPSRTPNIKGSGLGLGIARRIVEKHGGSIWLRSDGKERGTTATVRLKRI